MSVVINGQESAIKGGGLSTFGDLIELIKSAIDPDHMITSIMIDGRELTDADWTSHPGRVETSIIEIETGTPESFAADRLAKASEVVRACFMEFRDARKAFQDGQMQVGNKKLLQAVNTLQAFFEWYGTMMELVPAADKARYDLTPKIMELSEVCKRICQQQLYQSWWALGESIEKELEPKLDKLEDFCRTFKTVN